jgi:hypothetical protein
VLEGVLPADWAGSPDPLHHRSGSGRSVRLFIAMRRSRLA